MFFVCKLIKKHLILHIYTAEYYGNNGWPSTLHLGPRRKTLYSYIIVHKVVYFYAWLIGCVFVLQAFGPPAGIPSSETWLPRMVRLTKLPFWTNGRQNCAKHSCLQRHRHGGKVRSAVVETTFSIMNFFSNFMLTSCTFILLHQN